MTLLGKVSAVMRVGKRLVMTVRLDGSEAPPVVVGTQLVWAGGEPQVVRGFKAWPTRSEIDLMLESDIPTPALGLLVHVV